MNKWGYLIISILVLFNIKLLHVTNDLRNQYSLIDIHEELTNYNDLRINLDALNNQGNGLQVVTIIWEISCSSCIGQEVMLLNSYYEKFGNMLNVIYISNSLGSELNGANFPYKTLFDVNEILNKDIHPQNPLSILFDRNYVYEIREVKIDRPHSKLLSENYYENKLQLLVGLN